MIEFDKFLNTSIFLLERNDILIFFFNFLFKEILFYFSTILISDKTSPSEFNLVSIKLS